ncbi:MAG: hypothetical protein ACYC2U_08310, partial [Candidatus Amoebophilus sp.]
MATILKSNNKVLKSKNTWSSFNGTSSFIQYADNDIFSFTDGVNDLPFEIEFDVKFNSFSDFNYILNKRNTNTSTAEYLIRVSSTGILTIYLFRNNTNYIYKSIVTELKLNNQYNLKITYNGIGLRAGILIYIDNNIVATTDGEVGTYTYMSNTNTTLDIGRATPTTNSFLNGYLRNLKITKNNQLVFHAPLQDTLNVSKDIISGLVGTVNNVSVVDINEGGNWAYFNGVNAYSTIGTTSTLGWMNSGVFNMEFEFYPLETTNSKNIIYFAGGVTQKGLRLYWYNSLIYIYWYNGAGTQSFICNFGTFIIGNSYKIVLFGDSVNFYYINYNSDGSINSTNNPIGVPCVYIPNSTTSYPLLIASNTSTFLNCKIRNVKFFTDTAGTIPFLSLPMQNASDLMTDRITGLQGTAYNVQIINNNTNALRHKNLWTYFDGITSALSIGTTSTLGWMNNGIFNLQFEVIPVVLGSAKYLLYTGYGVNVYGFAIYFNLSNNTISAYLMNGTATFPFNSTGLINIPLNNRYKLILQGNGTQCRYIQYNLTTDIEVFNSGWLSCLFNSNATTYQPLNFSTVAKANCYLRNVKICTDTEGKVPFMNLPLQDGGNITKDIVGGLQGTI